MIALFDQDECNRKADRYFHVEIRFTEVRETEILVTSDDWDENYM